MVLQLIKPDLLDQEVKNPLSATSSTPALHRPQLQAGEGHPSRLTNRKPCGCHGSTFATVAGFVFGSDVAVYHGTGVLVQNMALSQTADQSSSYPGGPARNAVDGNRDPNFAKGSCSHTQRESNPWWRVDLQNVYTVTAVMITNRNKFENRLDGAEIWIGTSLEDNGAKKSSCAIISHIPKGRTFYFPCSSTEGRYVTVFLPGTEKILTLCKVEVFPLDYAIDGRRNPIFYDRFCTHTKKETNPWWRLDLRETHAVTSVKVTNRRDCCAQRLDGAEIRIGNSAENNGNDNPK
ncbi:uncharacterized protein LOC132958941 [Labrus mixtus]|uniref:uncharacterized protein LOC132958941 n=1 Tax=Labrus mixtus TaxID=508554 RepID=UPI0029C03D17|nr:uncharacterized protein LOC132958941 [Labrus mixtus]